jgi:hypothetical protein
MHYILSSGYRIKYTIHIQDKIGENDAASVLESSVKAVLSVYVDVQHV